MLPKNLKYGSRVESAPAKSLRSNIAPQNGTGPYGLGDTIMINIPTRRNLVLVPSESYLKFSVSFTNTTATDQVQLRWDSCGAHGLFSRLRIFHGSNLVQDISEYSMLVKILYDLQVNTGATYGKYNVMSGCRSDQAITLKPNLLSSATAVNGVAVAGHATAVVTPPELTSIINSLGVIQGVSNQINSGDFFASTAVANPTAPQTYCINLVSLLGSLCANNYFPLFACDSAPLRLELTLHDSIQKIWGTFNPTSTNTLSGTIAVRDCEYVANMIELGQDAMSMVQESLNGQPLQFVVPDWRNYQYSQAPGNAATISIQFPIPAKFASLKSIFVTQRDRYGLPYYFPCSSVMDGIRGYQFRIGANLYPLKSPSSSAEMFAECLKAMGSISDLNYTPSVEKGSYTLQNSEINTSITAMANGLNHSGSFYIGLDLENYAGASKDSIFAGYNSNTDDVYCVIDLVTPNLATPTIVPVAGGVTAGSVVTPARGTNRYDAFAMFDAVIVFENGTCYSRF